MSKITNAMLMEAINGINNKIDAISKRVDTLEGKSKPTASSKGKAEKSATTKGYSTKITDYEPKKGADGHYVWVSYKAKRKDYCYAVATKGEALGCYKNGKKVAEFADIEADYNKAKAEFDKKYPYTKKADR